MCFPSRSSSTRTAAAFPVMSTVGNSALIAGFGYLGDDDRADGWFSHGWLDTPLDLLRWLDKRRSHPHLNGNGTE